MEWNGMEMDSTWIQWQQVLRVFCWRCRWASPMDSHYSSREKVAPPAGSVEVLTQDLRSAGGADILFDSQRMKLPAAAHCPVSIRPGGPGGR